MFCICELLKCLTAATHDPFLRAFLSFLWYLFVATKDRRLFHPLSFIYIIQYYYNQQQKKKKKTVKTSESK